MDLFAGDLALVFMVQTSDIPQSNGIKGALVEWKYSRCSLKGEYVLNLDLNQFALQCRTILQQDNSPSGRARVAELLKQFLADRQTLQGYFLPNTGERELLYEDPDLGFCILAHSYKGPKTSGPHDHAHSWAIYGQADGETQMTDYELIEKPLGDSSGKVRASRAYKLTPGEVYVYNEGDIHSPSRLAPTNLIRIEGTNMTKVKRDSFTLVQD
jgi:predicted metal-dependent enzyme (double-stranded beta helix superfamily)